MAEVLVTGATGTLGGHVARRLLERGHRVRALNRGGQVPIARAQALRGDLASGAGLEEATRGIDAIVHCASAGGSLSSRTLRATDVEGTRRLLAAAHSSASPHVLYPSIVGIDHIPFAYYRAKLAAERILEDSGLPWTIVRATQFHDLILRVFSRLGRLPVVPLPRGFSFQPIEAGEVAERLVELVEAGPASRTDPLGGPQIVSARDLARAYLAAVSRPPRVIQMPLPGATSRAFRAGHNLCPDQRSGRTTWEAFLETTLSKGTAQYRSSDQA